MALAGWVTFGAGVSKLFGAPLVDGKGPADGVVAVDGAALLRHAGLEVKVALPGISCHAELGGVLPVGARVVAWAPRDGGVRDWPAAALAERRGPEAVEARLVHTAPPAARSSGHADPGDGAAESLGVASGD